MSGSKPRDIEIRHIALALRELMMSIVALSLFQNLHWMLMQTGIMITWTDGHGIGTWQKSC